MKVIKQYDYTCHFGGSLATALDGRRRAPYAHWDLGKGTPRRCKAPLALETAQSGRHTSGNAPASAALAISWIRSSPVPHFVFARSPHHNRKDRQCPVPMRFW